MPRPPAPAAPGSADNGLRMPGAIGDAIGDAIGLLCAIALGAVSADGAPIGADGAAMGAEGTPMDDHRASAAYRSATLGTALLKLHAENATPQEVGA